MATKQEDNNVEEESEEIQDEIEDEIEDEIDAAPPKEDAAGSFCNFDISGLLEGDNSSEDDELMENLQVDYKVL